MPKEPGSHCTGMCFWGGLSGFRGVPRTVLGPILFLLYINDLPEYVNCPVCLFADGCVIWVVLKRWLPKVLCCFFFFSKCIYAQGNMLTIKYLCGLSTYKNIAVPLALDFVWQVNTDPQVCMLV